MIKVSAEYPYKFVKHRKRNTAEGTALNKAAINRARGFKKINKRALNIHRPSFLLVKAPRAVPRSSRIQRKISQVGAPSRSSTAESNMRCRIFVNKWAGKATATKILIEPNRPRLCRTGAQEDFANPKMRHKRICVAPSGIGK